MDQQHYTISLESVFKAYYICRKNKRKTFNALKFEVNYECNCVKLWREINEKTYKIGKSIAFVISKPKYREVFAADFRDRIVHHIIVMRLEPLFEKVFIQDNYNCRKEKGVLYGVKRFYTQIKEISNDYTKDCYIGKFDMQGFFMSIHKPTLWKFLKKFIEENYNNEDKEILLWLVYKVVTNNPEKNCIIKCPKERWRHIPANKSLFTTGSNYGLPIGNLTSQIFANFYLHWFDIWMQSTFDGYGRYVDDFYIIDRDKDKILKNINIIKKILSSIQVKLHPKKIYIQHYSKGCKFTGSVIKMNRLYVGNYTRGQFFNKVIKLNNLKLDKNFYNNIEYIISCINSYLGFLIHYNSFNIRSNILLTLDKKYSKYFSIGQDCKKIICKSNYKYNKILKQKLRNKYFYKKYKHYGKYIRK